MDRRSGLGDGGASPRRAAEMDALLRESVRASGLEGRPLTVHSSPFMRDSSAVVSGLLGPPAWAVRLKQIHDGRTRLKATLDAGWAEHARRWRGRPDEFASRWRTFLAKLDLAALNTLIKKHNDYYPIEARLPIMYPSNRYYVPAGIEYPQQPITVDSMMDEYPADLDMATYFTTRRSEAAG